MSETINTGAAPVAATFTQITVNKTGAATTNVKLPLGTTIGQAIELLDRQPSFSGKTYQKYVTTVDHTYIDSLVGASGVDVNRVMANGDSISYISKVDAGR